MIRCYTNPTRDKVELPASDPTRHLSFLFIIFKPNPTRPAVFPRLAAAV